MSEGDLAQNEFHDQDDVVSEHQLEKESGTSTATPTTTTTAKNPEEDQQLLVDDYGFVYKKGLEMDKMARLVLCCRRFQR